MHRSLYTAGLASVVVASLADAQSVEALNNAGLSFALAGLYAQSLALSRPEMPVMGCAPEPDQFEYGRWNADGSYDRIIWPYGGSVVEDQFMPQGNRIPPNVRS